MSAIDVIKRRLKEERSDVPDEVTEKKKRPREVAFMDVNLCFPCGKCPEFCPVQCIEYLAPGSVPGRGVQPGRTAFRSASAATSASRCARCSPTTTRSASTTSTWSSSRWA